MPLLCHGDVNGLSNSYGLFLHAHSLGSSDLPSPFPSFEFQPSSKLLPFPTLPYFELPSFEHLSFEQLLSPTLSSFQLPSPTLLSFEHPCLAMPFSKVPSPKMSFHVHEFLFDVSPSPTTIIISTSRHLNSSSSVHVEAPCHQISLLT
jgi:hypothetical protein